MRQEYSGRAAADLTVWRRGRLSIIDARWMPGSMRCSPARAAAIRAEHGVHRRLRLGDAAAARLGAGGVRPGQAQPGSVLAGDARRHRRQHPRRRGHLVDGLRRRACLRVRHATSIPTAGRCAGWSASAPKACLLSWLPVVGDPLCAVAGWLQLPFWPCVVYMAIGKFGRYVVDDRRAALGLPRPVSRRADPIRMTLA